MDLRQELIDLGFVRAGEIRPLDSGQRCRAFLDRDVEGFLVYAHIVGDQAKKFGITSPRLKSRVSQNVSTINQVIQLLAGRARRDAKWHHRPLDGFKRLAPLIIQANQAIEVWVVQSTEAEYKLLERTLNAKYNTIANGWATLLS